MFFVEKNRDTFYLEHKLDTLYHWFYFFEGLITSITNSEIVVDRKYFSLDKMITNSPNGSSAITCLYWNIFDNNHFIVSYLYNNMPVVSDNRPVESDNMPVHCISKTSFKLQLIVKVKLRKNIMTIKILYSNL